MDVKPTSSTMAQHSNNKVISNGSAHCISAQKAKCIFESEEVNLSLAAPRSKLAYFMHCFTKGLYTTNTIPKSSQKKDPQTTNIKRTAMAKICPLCHQAQNMNG